jgi:hypothetical protein
MDMNVMGLAGGPKMDVGVQWAPTKMGKRPKFGKAFKFGNGWIFGV